MTMIEHDYDYLPHANALMVYTITVCVGTQTTVEKQDTYTMLMIIVIHGSLHGMII